MTVILAPSADLAKSRSPDVTVEAEYGSVVIEGSFYTAAHHQGAASPYAGRHMVEGGRPAPCNDGDIPVTDGEILVSHLDLDTVGGCLRAMGITDLFEHASFWELAEFVDTHGPHKIGESGASGEDLERMYAVWARGRGPRFARDEVTDITQVILDTERDLRLILAGDEDMIQAGREFREAGEKLNRESFVEFRDGVIVRVAPGFVNHLYVTPEGDVAKSVVAYNTVTGAVTVSLADPIEGVSCRDIVQGLWGPEAGGHDGIAGGPRQDRMTLADLTSAVEAMRERLV